MMERGRISEPLSLFKMALSQCMKYEKENGAFFYVIEGDTLFIPYAEGDIDLLREVLAFSKKMKIPKIQFSTYREGMLKRTAGICQEAGADMAVIGFIVRLSI